MQPFYIKAMWYCLGGLMVAFQTFGIFASKLHREQMNAFMFGVFVLAMCITGISNKVRSGTYLPGVKKRK